MRNNNNVDGKNKKKIKRKESLVKKVIKGKLVFHNQQKVNKG